MAKRSTKMSTGGALNRSAAKQAVQTEEEVIDKVRRLSPNGGTGRVIPNAEAAAARIRRELATDNERRRTTGGDPKMSKGGVAKKRK